MPLPKKSSAAARMGANERRNSAGTVTKTKRTAARQCQALLLVEQVVSARNQPAQPEERIQLAAARGGGQASQVGGDLAILRHELRDFLRRHLARGRGAAPRARLAAKRAQRSWPAATSAYCSRAAPVSPRGTHALRARGLLALEHNSRKPASDCFCSGRCARKRADHLRGQRPQPRRIQRVDPRQEALQQVQLVVGKRGGQRGRRRNRWAQRRRLRGAHNALAHDDRAGQLVARAFAGPRNRYTDQADQVGKWPAACRECAQCCGHSRPRTKPSSHHPARRADAASACPASAHPKAPRTTRSSPTAPRK